MTRPSQVRIQLRVNMRAIPVKEIVHEKRDLKFVLFVLPPARDRISDYRQLFAESGLTLCFAEFGEADEQETKDLFLDIMNDWGPYLVCVFHPQLDIIDKWVIEAQIRPKPGNVIDFLKLFGAQGIPVNSVKMEWGGAFDDRLCLYDYDVPELVRFAHKRMKSGDVPLIVKD